MLGSITFGSLVSGIDTDSIVNAMVSTRRFQIDQLNRQAEGLNFYKGVLRGVNSQLLNVQQSMLNLRLESTFKNKKVSFSHDNYISANVGFNAVPRSYIMEVKNLARGAAAISGLNDRSFMRGGAALIRNNTAGISSVEVTSTNLTGMKAGMNTLLTETLQAGKGANAVTAGDQISISGTRKDGSAVNASFTFNGDNTDTVQRLANTIKAAFQGDVEVYIDSNGSLSLIERDTSVAGDFALTGLDFIDTDYSGSTLTIGIGTSMASGGPQAQILTGNRTFTTNNSLNIATAATALDSNLDQITGGDLGDGVDRIHIAGKDRDGNSIDTYYTYSTGDTFQELLDAIETAYGSTVTATMENGKIVVTDNLTGESELSMSLSFEDGGGNENSFSLGFNIVATRGADSTEQIAKTTELEIPSEGKYFLNFSDGMGGQITGTVSIAEDTLLGNIGGITSYNLFTVDRDTGSGNAAPVTILGLNERSSIRDLIEAINSQVPDVTAGLADDGMGGNYLQITSNRGGEELRITDGAGGILENILNPTAGVDTDYTTSNASTDTTDFTVTAQFISKQGASPVRSIYRGTEGSPINDLVDNLSIRGGDFNRFNAGFGIIYTTESSELNIIPATHTHIIGNSGVSSSDTTPRLNVLASLATAGFASVPQNQEDSQYYHTDGYFSINGVRIAIDDVNRMTVNELIGAINSSGAGVIASYDSATDRFMLQATASGPQSIKLGAPGDTSNFLTIAGLSETAGGVYQGGSAKGKIDPDAMIAQAGFTFLPGSGTFTINGVKVFIDQSVDTLNTVIKKINNSGAGVTAVYDDSTDRLNLMQDLTREVFFDKITVGDASDTSAFLAAVRLTDNPSVPTVIGTERQKAELTLDGTTYYRDNNIVDDLITDVTLTLRSITQNPINLDITVDTERSIEYLATFVAEYNTLMQIMNPQPLTPDERKGLKELSEAVMNRMSYAEIEAYENNRTEYRARDIIFTDSSLRRLRYSIRNTLFNPVVSMTGEVNSLSDLNIRTGAFNMGVEKAQSPYLVTDSTDVETIKARLQEDPKLLTRLRNDYEDLYDLFANTFESTVEVKGTINLITGITVNERMSFQVGTGGKNATVTFEAGNYTYAQLMNTIQKSLADNDLLNDIYVGLSSDNKLVIRNKSEATKANIYLFDLNAGDSINDRLGIESGIFRGEDPKNSAGLSVRMESYLKSYTGIGGIIQGRITTGGQIDRELGLLVDQMEMQELRLEQYEQRLRRQFIHMEMLMAQYQQTSTFLANRMASMQSQNNQSGTFGI